jgi:peptide/nickel transport system ATP-binding protein
MSKVLRVEKLRKWFPVRTGFLSSVFGREKQAYVKAVDGVSFDIDEGEILGLVGESGCGKTTTGKSILRLIEPTDGRIFYKDIDILSLGKSEMNKLRVEMQTIFQNPYESLNPRSLVYDIVAEPLSVQKVEGSHMEMVSEMLEVVGLTPVEDILYRYPHELSGGQRQRVAIARALVLRPKFIVADEPISMLDMSMRGSLLNLMLDLIERFRLSYLYITHDLSVTKHICDRLGVMYLGKIVEKGDAIDIIDDPMHPYVKALIEAVPITDPRIKIGEIPIKGEVPNPIDIPSGCRFHPRCPSARDACMKEEPTLEEVSRSRFVACHMF